MREQVWIKFSQEVQNFEDLVADKFGDELKYRATIANALRVRFGSVRTFLINMEYFDNSTEAIIIKIAPSIELMIVFSNFNDSLVVEVTEMFSLSSLVEDEYIPEREQVIINEFSNYQAIERL